MSTKTGADILAELKAPEGVLDETMVVPLGADPVQMRKDQEAAQASDDSTDEGKIKRPTEKVSKEDLEKIKKLDDAEDDDVIGLPIIALKTFKSFYIEGHTGVAAMMMADELGISVGDEMDEEVEEEFLLFLEGGAPSQLSFLRRSMTKFDAFMNMVKGAWEKLGDSKKEQIVKVLKSKSAKMGTEVKNKASALDPKNADDVMMLATFAYMYGLGLPGDGATAAEDTDDTVSE